MKDYLIANAYTIMILVIVAITAMAVLFDWLFTGRRSREIRRWAVAETLVSRRIKRSIVQQSQNIGGLIRHHPHFKEAQRDFLRWRKMRTS